MDARFPITVVDPRLAAGRGEEFSASRLKEQAEQRAADKDFRLPINQRIEGSLDDEGLQMASMHEFIPESNKGFQMLQRMGWKGQGLGSKEDGIVEPVGGGQEGGRLGLGKQEEDNFYTASDNIQRKRLETEIQADEDASRTAMREMQAEREQQIRQDVSHIKRTFFCEVCHKQYNSAAELEVHLSSYDHHHKKRLQEMRSSENERTRKDRDKREKRRQEKEMARLHEQIQKAHGILPGQGGAAEEEPPPPPPPEEEAPPPPPPADYLSTTVGNGSRAALQNMLPSFIQEPPPPLPPLPPGDAPISSPSSTVQSNAQRNSVQFNMSSSLKRKPATGNSLAVRNAGLQKKSGKLQTNVAAFAFDSDDEG